MIDVKQFRTYIVRPALEQLKPVWPGFASKEAEALVVETAIAESGLKYVRQLGGGPALGPYQMEPATHDWLIDDMGPEVGEVVEAVTTLMTAEEMIWNWRYATIMCRLRYYPYPAIPKSVGGRASYWKRYYNTRLGKGKPTQYVRRVQRARAASVLS